MPYKNIEIGSIKTAQTKVAVKQSQFYKGFSTQNPDGASTKLFDFELIKQDIINHFRTRKGERVMNPTFGSIICDLLMEPLTDEVRDALQKDVTEICNFDLRVAPLQIDLTEYDNGYILELTLLLKGTDQSTNLKLQFDQKVGLSVLE
jgi:phage baseplate assembly protein W